MNSRWSLLLFVLPLAAQAPVEVPPDAAAIMAKVAANVEAGQTARREYIYHQTVRGSLTQTNGKLVRRERREYDVLPDEKSTKKTLVELDGEYRKGKETTRYSQVDETEGIDPELLREMLEELVDDNDARDGIPHSLFPLVARDLHRYKFTWKERTEYRGRPAIRIRFDPLEKSFCADADGATDCNTPWKGEIWVDAEDLQPARIVTDLGTGIPWGVRVFLGTNVKQLGFSISYERVAPNVWFPATYGTEFRLDVLWFYKRNITLAMESKDFRHADAASTIAFEETGR